MTAIVHRCSFRLERFLEKARCVLDYFEPYLGRIEIMGGAGKIERVYFEIKQSNIDQWEKPQIKVRIRLDSLRATNCAPITNYSDIKCVFLTTKYIQLQQKF